MSISDHYLEQDEMSPHLSHNFQCDGDSIMATYTTANGTSLDNVIDYVDSCPNLEDMTSIIEAIGLRRDYLSALRLRTVREGDTVGTPEGNGVVTKVALKTCQVEIEGEVYRVAGWQVTAPEVEAPAEDEYAAV